MNGERDSSMASAPGHPARPYLRAVAVGIVALALVEALWWPDRLPTGWPPWLLVLPALWFALSLLVRPVFGRSTAAGFLLAAGWLFLVAILWAWPAEAPRSPAPWLAAAGAAAGVALRALPMSSSSPLLRAAARSLGAFLLALAALSAAAAIKHEGSLALGLANLLAFLLLGGWLAADGLRTGSQRVLRTCAAALAGLAWLVMCGWWLEVPFIVQGGTAYVPMQFNTATCALLTAVALWLLAVERRNLAVLPLVPVVLLGLVSLLEEFAGWKVGAGEWLISHGIVAEGVVPGRMAPNTAVGFLLAALGIALAPRADHASATRWSATWACGFVVGVVALIVLGGYALGIPVMRGWGSHTPMALMTGLAMALVGLGLGFAGSEYRRQSRQRAAWMPLVVAAGVVTASVMVWVAIDGDQEQQRRRLNQQQAVAVGDALQDGILGHRSAIRRMADRLGAAAIGEDRERLFDVDATIYLRDFPDFAGVLWLDPDTRVLRQRQRDDRPLDVVGRRLDFSLAREAVFARARETGDTAESVPLRLLDGKTGELLVAPSFDADGRLVGFALAAMYQDVFYPGQLDKVALPHPVRVLNGDRVVYQRGEPGPRPPEVVRPDPQRPSLQVQVWPDPASEASRTSLANTLLFTGLVTGGLLALALRLAGLARERAEEAEHRGEALSGQVAEVERARAALLAAEQELRSVFENISEAFYTLDRDWRFVYVNPRAEQLMRRRRDELVGRRVWDVFPDTLGTIIEREFRAAVAGERPGEFEVLFEPLSAWFQARLFPHPHGVAVYFRDISDRKRAEAAMVKARASSERAQRLAQLGSWEYDLATGELTWSDEVLRIFGLPRGQARIGLPAMLQMVHFEDRERLQAAQRRLHAGESDMDIEYRVLRPDGEVRHVRDLGTLVRDEAGRAVSASGAIQDVTERHRSEEALKELSRRLEQSLVMNRLVLDNSLDVICVIDANGRFAQVSNACRELWGYAPGELVGRAYFDLAHPEDRAHTLREGAAVLAGRPTVDFRNRVLRKDGSVVSMQWSAVWSPRDRMMFAVARDVTDAERQSRALQEAKDGLQRAQRIARMGAWQYDIAGDRLEWSDEVYDIFQVRPGEFAGNFEAFAARVHPEDLPVLQAAQARTLAGGPELDVEHRIMLPDGRIGHVHERARLERDEAGRPWRLAGSVQDITERKEAKAALEKERGFLRAMLESLSEGVVACDHEGRLTLFNRTTRELHGLPEAPVPSEEWASHYNLFQPDGVTPMAAGDIPLLRALRGEAVREVEMVIAPRDQPRRVVLCSGRQIVSESGELLGAVVAMHDITRRKRSDQLEAGQRAVLAGIAARRPLAESLLATTRVCEELFPGALCSILLLDEEGKHVLTGAAPSLPAAYNAAVHGLAIGPKAGSCGTAAWRGERVVVSDIASDPLWEDYRGLAAAHGLAACWSTPVRGSSGRVVATFATYYREPREPTAAELEGIDGLAALVAVAIEHAEAYRDLQLGQQRFRSLFDEHPDAVYSMDLEGRFTAVNDRFHALSGLVPETVLGKRFDDFVAPEQLDTVRAHFEAAVRGEARDFEMSTMSPDGRRVEFRVTHLPIMVDGRVTGVFGIAQDISLLRKHQRELSDALDAAEGVSRQLARLSQAAITINRDLDEGTLYQQLVDRVRDIVGAHQAVVSVDSPEGATQLVNAVSLSDKYAQWRGYDAPIDFSGIYMMVSEARRPFRMTQTELEAHPRWRGFGKESGRHPPMRGWLAVPLIGSDGGVIGILQLSDKERGEFSADDEQVVMQFAQVAAIAIERARLLAKLRIRDRFFELSLEVFVVFDPATRRFVQVNQVLSDITGYSREELCSRPFDDFVHPDDRGRSAERADDLAARRGVAARFANRYVCKDGRVRWMEWMSSPDDDGLVYAVGRDITERLRAEAALRQSLTDLNARNRELQDFAFIASHDLQEPLRKIRAFADRLQQRHAAALADEARDYLDRTSQAAARMQVLIDDLLAYSRVAARAKAFKPVDLGPVMAGVIEDLEATLEASGGRIVVGPLPTIEGDATQLRQLFQNLLSNALKFRAPGRAPVVEVGAERVQGVDGPAWILRFSDNGIGFEPRYAEKVFGPFQRLHGRQEYPGTGIGLAIVRRIVERHRGTIHAEGRPGEGATFVIQFPERQSPEPAGVAAPLSET